ncbi:hypothetical protein M9Y10_015861 [Tritrichomonas musculus]|uniref:Uncharacterized protein n=1 Tax=Tritrichomonas musculus TaxID=1915356 RepID=A0ABR2I503_9EUKA
MKGKNKVTNIIWKAILVQNDDQTIKYELNMNEKLKEKMKRRKKRSLFLSKMMLNQNNESLSFETEQIEPEPKNNMVFENSIIFSRANYDVISLLNNDKNELNISQSKSYEKPEQPIILSFQMDVIEIAIRRNQQFK